MTDLSLLEQLCRIHAPSGNETNMTQVILQYIENKKLSWMQQPKVFSGNDFQNCVILVFGQPRTAVYAHMDNIGFMVGYHKELIPIGKPEFSNGCILTGSDRHGPIECVLEVDENSEKIFYSYEREIERGTDLSFKCNYTEEQDFITSCYMDNRVGVFNALKLCESLHHGAVVFTCWEEHGGGTAGLCARFLYEQYKIRQALISDITWVTPVIRHGNGVAVSLRDSLIPRRVYLNRIRHILDSNNFPYQLEVESAGGSDGSEIQKLPYPIDWCFIGAPESNVHSANECIHKSDIESMLQCYLLLMKEL